MSTADALVPPRRRRREIILEVATALFSERGYHGVGINEIGAAAGISGPGLYRHFASKDEILIEIFDRAWRRLEPPAWVDHELKPAERLDYFVRAHTALAVEAADVVQLWASEQRHLPPTYLKRSQANFERYFDTWTQTLHAVRPELSRDEAGAIVLAVIGLINGSAQSLATVKPTLRSRVVIATATAALAASVSDERPRKS